MGRKLKKKSNFYMENAWGKSLIFHMEKPMYFLKSKCLRRVFER